MTVAYCHCASCRRHTGAPVVAWVAYESHQVRYSKGKRKIYNSSPGVERAFCGECGTPLTWEGESRRFAGKLITEFHISTLDDPLTYVPDRHWFDSERLAWFDIADSLPRYRELDGYELLVLDDARPGALEPSRRRALRKLLAQRRGRRATCLTCRNPDELRSALATDDADPLAQAVIIDLGPARSGEPDVPIDAVSAAREA